MPSNTKEIEIIIESLEIEEGWSVDLKSLLKTWIRTYYSENPNGGKVNKDLDDLVEAIYLFELEKNKEVES